MYYVVLGKGVEVEGVYFEVKRWRLKGCSFRLMWRK